MRYHLRTLLIVLALASACMAWVAHERRHVTARRHAIEAIEAAGGSVGFAHIMGCGMGGPPPGPEWLAQALGDENAFARVEYVTFYSPQGKPTRSTLVHVAQLREVKVLHLDAGPFSGDDLALLESLESLEDVSLQGVNVNESVVPFIRRQHSLQLLQLFRPSPAIVEAIKAAVPPGCHVSYNEADGPDGR
jgi:hypothetical protein